MVQQPIQHRRRHRFVRHELGPLRERPIGCQYNGPGFVADIDELKEDVGLLGREGLMSDLIEQKDIRLAEPRQSLPMLMRQPPAPPFPKVYIALVFSIDL